MRRALLLAVVLSLAAAAAAAGAPGQSQSLEVKDARGVIVIKGKGALIGRIERGSLQITDLTPRDEWSPWINGLPRGKAAGTRGENISFRLLKGRYRIVVRGEGISISARGEGTIVLDGEPDAVGDTGLFKVGDRTFTAVPGEALELDFGASESPGTDGSVKIRP